MVREDQNSSISSIADLLSSVASKAVFKKNPFIIMSVDEKTAASQKPKEREVDQCKKGALARMPIQLMINVDRQKRTCRPRK